MRTNDEKIKDLFTLKKPKPKKMCRAEAEERAKRMSTLLDQVTLNKNSPLPDFDFEKSLPPYDPNLPMDDPVQRLIKWKEVARELPAIRPRDPHNPDARPLF
jgi:hypothetical protein